MTIRLGESAAVPPYRVRLAISRGGHVLRLAVTDGTPGDADEWRLGAA